MSAEHAVFVAHRFEQICLEEMDVHLNSMVLVVSGSYLITEYLQLNWVLGFP